MTTTPRSNVSPPSPLDDTFASRVLHWHRQHGRHDLPWQTDTTPYRVWISEIMLQQTQVATVIDYYQRFMQRFPTVASLADAKQDDVMALWAGLGYYSRARNLHKAAQMIRNDFGGEFPKAFDDVIALPGIGRSTAGSLLAIATDQRFPILDGNVKRVLTRHFAIEGWPGQAAVEKQLWHIADELTPTANVATYTQAIMDLGATVCTRTRPRCDSCPLSTTCQALATNRTAELPHRKPSKKKPVRNTVMIMLINDNNEVLLHKRPNYGIWGGLWSLPEADSADRASAWTKAHVGAVTTSQQLPLPQPFRHTFSHYHLDILPLLLTTDTVAGSDTLRQTDDYAWHAIKDVAQLGLPQPVKQLLSQLS